MFRCSECNAEYSEKPEFCECGNDEFIEVEDDQYEEEEVAGEEYVQAAPSSIFEQNSIDPQAEVQEEVIEEEKFNFDATIVKKKKITILLLAISMIVSVLLLCFVGNSTPKPKLDEKQLAEKKANLAKMSLAIPDIDAIWDDTPAFKVTKSSNGQSYPLLNDNLRNLSAPMKNYLVDVGKIFMENWQKSMVNGSGTCIIEFTIDKNGELDKKKIASKSQNESLNESVLLTLSKVTNVDTPPSDYKGERIRLSFVIDKDLKVKVLYPD